MTAKEVVCTENLARSPPRLGAGPAARAGPADSSGPSILRRTSEVGESLQ